MTTVQSLRPGFSMADASLPELVFRGDALIVTFDDWREHRVWIHFHDVCAFRWQAIESLVPGEAYDAACELHESEWLALHRTRGAVPEGSSHRHVRFNFNAAGQLEVLCTRWSVEI